MTKTATYYDVRWRQENSEPHAPNPLRVDLLAKQVHQRLPQGPSAVLDVGCGNGWVLERIAQLPHCELELYGVEPSSVGCQNARQRVPRATIWEGTLEEVAFHRRFDFLTCSEVLEHIENQQDFVARLTQLVSDHGVLVLTTPNGRYRSTYFEKSAVDPQPIEKWVDVDSLRGLLLAHFRSVSIVSFDLHFFYRIHPQLAQLRENVLLIRGGWRASQIAEGLLKRYGKYGMYLMAVAHHPR